jgi:CCR4-NOT transcriptional complex subunit CAF120
MSLSNITKDGRPNADRTWTECFAQLVGTVLSLWDAAELDAAGQDGEVLPKFMNLTDSSIKMVRRTRTVICVAVLTPSQIESLPTRSENEPPLQNVLSISTAGKNRYLLHFNSHHSLIQWTAGIRLAMFEHATLQEAYTGALIAGKGKALNNINLIMDRTKTRTEDWARVRFGAGTPWRRCWCVITPPDEKEVQKLHRQANKKKSAYDRSRLPALKGDIKFYESKKTKKVNPIATISNAYSAFAIYPQAKPLIDASTLVKVEGTITIHSNLPSSSEGFVFVMPEVHPAVTGFEIMLRWLFPVFDTFALYGRPGRLIADTTNPQSLMFAMPKHRRYGYLEILDVSGLILEQGSSEWKESEWRHRMKDLTSKRMNAVESGSRTSSRYSSRKSTRNSYGPSRTRIQFDDAASVRSSPHIGRQSPQPESGYGGIPRTDSAPPVAMDPLQPVNSHYRSASETQILDRFANVSASNYDGGYDQGPPPPPHNLGIVPGSNSRYTNETGSTPETGSSEDERIAADMRARGLEHLHAAASPEPVAPPPAFSHSPGSLPTSKPWHSPELRRANSRMSHGTLTQLVGASGASGVAAATAYRSSVERAGTSEEQRLRSAGQYSEDMGQRDQRGVFSGANMIESPANTTGLHEGFVTRSSPAHPLNTDARTNIPQPPPQYPYPNSTFTPNSQASRTTQAPSQPGHAAQKSTDSTRSDASQLSRLQTSPGVARKPLPPSSSIVQSPASANTLSSSGSLGEHVLDEAAFNLIGSPSDRKNTLVADRSRADTSTSVYPEDIHRSKVLQDPPPMPPMPPMHDLRVRSNTDDSVYEDDTRYESSNQEKGRTGVLRTVGNVQDTQHGGGSNDSNPLIPNVDFGPTYNLASDQTPRQRSPARRASPAPAQIGRELRAPRRPSPAPVAHSRSPTRTVIAPDGVHYRSESGEGRTLPWHPGMSAVGVGSPSMQAALTAEEFVQQRAVAAATTPLYAHQRQNSGNILPRSTPTPPLARSRSSEYLAPQGNPRSNSADILQAPRSRSSYIALSPQQQQAQYQQYSEQRGDYRAPQSHYGNMGQYPQAQHPDQSLRQQQWATPPPQGPALSPEPIHSPLYSPPPVQYFANPQFPTATGGKHDA